MHVKRIFLPFVLTMIAVPLAAGGFRAVSQPDVQVTSPPADEEPGQLIEQPVATAEPTAEAASEISALGSVEANSVVSLYFQISGTIDGIYAQVGDSVEAGDVLVDLDATDAWSTYQQAQLNLESAQISMEDLLAPPSDSEIAVAKANVASAQAAYSSTANATSAEEIEQYQLKYQQAQAQLEALQAARANMNGTDEEIALQDAQIGAASFNAEIARLQLEEAQTPNSTSLWSAGIKIQQAQLQLAQLQEDPTQAEIDSAQIAIDRAEANVADAQTTLLETQLVSPVSGYITTLDASEGDIITNSTAILEISDTTSLKMTVPVNELDIQQVEVGQDVIIQLDALPDTELAGQVESVGWLSDTSSDGIVTYDVRIVLLSDDPRVKIGMTGEVIIQTGSENS